MNQFTEAYTYIQTEAIAAWRAAAGCNCPKVGARAISERDSAINTPCPKT